MVEEGRYGEMCEIYKEKKAPFSVVPFSLKMENIKYYHKSSGGHLGQTLKKELYISLTRDL